MPVEPEVLPEVIPDGPDPLFEELLRLMFPGGVPAPVRRWRYGVGYVWVVG